MSFYSAHPLVGKGSRDPTPPVLPQEDFYQEIIQTATFSYSLGDLCSVIRGPPTDRFSEQENLISQGLRITDRRTCGSMSLIRSFSAVILC